jgi:hypothetical protein
VSRKYTPPKKKRSPSKLPVRSRVSQAAGMAGTPAVEYAAPRPAIRVSPATELASDSVKYASLPRELKRIGLLTAAALVILILLWLIFR